MILKLEDTDLEEKQPTPKKLTLQEMSANASNSIRDMLATMEKYSEWKKEREELEEIYNQFKEFVSDIGLQILSQEVHLLSADNLVT